MYAAEDVDSVEQDVAHLEQVYVKVAFEPQTVSDIGKTKTAKTKSDAPKVQRMIQNPRYSSQ
jgi:hypothetical protein